MFDVIGVRKPANPGKFVEVNTGGMSKNRLTRDSLMGPSLKSEVAVFSSFPFAFLFLFFFSSPSLIREFVQNRLIIGSRQSVQYERNEVRLSFKDLFDGSVSLADEDIFEVLFDSNMKI